MIDFFNLQAWELWGLWGVFFAGFLAASVFPANSELVFLAYVTQFPHKMTAAWLAASFGNSLGGASSWLLGRFFPKKPAISPKMRAFLQKFGAASLFFSWLPLIGDALCVAAGLFRLPFWRCFFFLALGKSLRYALLALPFSL